MQPAGILFSTAPLERCSQLAFDGGKYLKGDGKTHGKTHESDGKSYGGHHETKHIAGAMAKSGKGGTVRVKTGHQTIAALPAWGRVGADVYVSSRWDDRWEIYGRYHTPKKIWEWWTTQPWEWVFFQEVPIRLKKSDVCLGGRI